MSEPFPPPLIVPLGEAALTIRLGEVANVEFSERAAALAEFIRHENVDGAREVVPGVASVTVHYEIAKMPSDARRARLMDVVARSAHAPRNATAFATHSISTHFDGPDLADVAERVGLTTDEVIRRHTARDYQVLTLGFLPGWAYLGPLDPSLSLPRRSTPRTRVPAGSVAIMGTQTGIYPRVSPGGWHLIGTSTVVLFDATRDRPSLFRAGDRVRFVRAG